MKQKTIRIFKLVLVSLGLLILIHVALQEDCFLMAYLQSTKSYGVEECIIYHFELDIYEVYKIILSNRKILMNI